MQLPIRNRVVVLTGAASGIGAALARSLAARGAVLALIDRDPAGLDAVAAKVRKLGARASEFVLDLEDGDAIRRLPERVAGDPGIASILINNAGVALAGSFRQVTEEQFDRVMAINFHAPVAMVRAFLPQLMANGPAQIVNLSSLFGLIGVPEQAAYCSSKFAIRGFSEALREELAKENVGVSVVHPGGVRTNIAKSAAVGPGVDRAEYGVRLAGADKFLRMDPNRAAEIIVRGLERRQKRILVGSDAKMLALLQRLMPVSYARFLTRG
jgi:short-subunit dehydrogenase